MIRKYEKLEGRKYKGSHLWIFFVFVLGASFCLTSMTLFSKHVLGSDLAWFKALDAYLFAKLLLTPVFVASLIGKSVDLENRGSMWKILYSSGLDFKKIYWSKLMYIFKRILLFQLLEWLVLIVLCKQLGIKAELPYIRALMIFLSQGTVSYFLLVLHYLLSLKWANQLISTSVAILGTLTGMIFMLLSKGLALINPYAWMANLFSLSYIKVGEKFIENLNPINHHIFLVSLILGLALSVVGSNIKGEE